MKCHIFGAGEYGSGLPDIKNNDIVIAADGGYKMCKQFGFTPNAVIGDFDSLGYIPDDNKAVTVLPKEKDVSDLDAAVQTGLLMGADEFVLYGVFGGRIDHTLANLCLTARLSRQGISATMVGNGVFARAVTNQSLTVNGTPGKTVSVFSFTEVSTGVTLEGLKYPLQNAELTAGFALGLSNSFVSGKAKITVTNGTLLVICYL